MLTSDLSVFDHMETEKQPENMKSHKNYFKLFNIKGGVSGIGRMSSLTTYPALPTLPAFRSLFSVCTTGSPAIRENKHVSHSFRLNYHRGGVRQRDFSMKNTEGLKEKVKVNCSRITDSPLMR